MQSELARYLRSAPNEKLPQIRTPIAWIRLRRIRAAEQNRITVAFGADAGGGFEEADEALGVVGTERGDDGKAGEVRIGEGNLEGVVAVKLGDDLRERRG